MRRLIVCSAVLLGVTDIAYAEWSQFEVVVRDYYLPSYEILNAPSYGIYAYNDPAMEPAVEPAAIATPVRITRLAQPRYTAADIALIKAHFAELRVREYAAYQAQMTAMLGDINQMRASSPAVNNERRQQALLNLQDQLLGQRLSARQSGAVSETKR